jgi:hypothetical protein
MSWLTSPELEDSIVAVSVPSWADLLWSVLRTVIFSKADWTAQVPWDCGGDRHSEEH